ncbi:MAG: hypothetical protein Q4G14_07560 [Paracoccus sp. (in: a-proteobacteria)]|uniref:hypothetical protein n=1 Tax=Paracoccus sp. TaxID=267 RepID=UPI0026DF4DA7|nr:hypothetical protein [Paracoccus sp. (in: a-proteobacteria)]MDO5613084.1 hypothetical protein [Paracoccus sp. (in: a-proteobacteria)]
MLKGQDGKLPVAVPRDHDSSFELEFVKKGQIRLDRMDDKIIGLCRPLPGSPNALPSWVKPP